MTVTTEDGKLPKEFWEIWRSIKVGETTFVRTYGTEIKLTCLWESQQDYNIKVIDIKSPIDPTSCGTFSFRFGHSRAVCDQCSPAESALRHS